jgi:hypothetical protein
MADTHHSSAKRVSAYALRDGEYRIIEDEVKETRYGTARSLAIQHLVPEVVLTWLPKSTLVPEGSLVGKYFLSKTTLDTKESPRHGTTYAIQFRQEEQQY